MDEPSPNPQPTVAVVGSGAAGLGTAWLLARGNYNVHLFEANSTPGGHANTVDVPIPATSPPATIPVDTGFIVYNTATYPDIVSLFEFLGVEEENSSMSFASSVSLPSGQLLEWGSDSLASLFADRPNLYRPSMYLMLYDVNRFNHAVYDFVNSSKDPTFQHLHMTLAQFLDQGSYSHVFIHSYLVPMVSAVWSASFNAALDFPARSLFHFFVNHGLAQIFNRPQWRTPAKRSRDYVSRLLADFAAHGGTVHLSSPVNSVSRHNDFVKLCVDGSDPLRFDQVVFATHPPETLKILGQDVTEDELRILSAFKYSTNKAYVHHDIRLMPKNRAVWSSWNFIGPRPEKKSDVNTITTPNGAISDTDRKSSANSSESDYLSKGKVSEDDGKSTSNGQSNQPHENNVTNESNDKKQNDVAESLISPQNGGNAALDSQNEEDDDEPVCVSYWLNRLQNYHKYHLNVPDLFLTLNPITPIDPNKILTALSYDHPQFTEEAVSAQPKLQEEIQGKNRTWFCGAYTRYGFHEDAMMSGLDVAEQLTDYRILRPWKSKNCLAINDNARLYDIPCSPLRSPIFVFLGALLVINAVISRLQAGLGKIAASMTDSDPVVVVASGEGRLHRFGPRRISGRSSSFFSFSRVQQSSTKISSQEPSAARITVRSPKVLARIADALRQGLELAPTAAAAFAAAELDCPSPTDLSETLRALFIADGLDDPSNARRGRAKLAENLLFAIVGNFKEVRSMSVHTRLPELTTCMLNVVSPSWWLELDQSKNELDANNKYCISSKVSPCDLNSGNKILELIGDLSELTVSLLQRNAGRRATIVVQTAERSDFVKSKADLLSVGDQVTIILIENFKTQRKAEIGESDDLDNKKESKESLFNVIFSAGLLNNFKCCGFESVEDVLTLIQCVSAPNAVVELGAVVYGKKRVNNQRGRKEQGTNPLFSSDKGFRLWEISDVLKLSEADAFDLQNVSFLEAEEAAMDIYEVIERVYSSLATEKLEPAETRSVLAQMCLWQAALGVKYLRRMAVSFTIR